MLSTIITICLFIIAVIINNQMKNVDENDRGAYKTALTIVIGLALVSFMFTWQGQRMIRGRIYGL